MKLSTKGRYAVTAMMELGIRQARGPVTLSDIADSQGISLSYLEQLFARLRRDGLVSGVRGPGGGYRLARPMAAVSVARIITAVDNPGTGNPSSPADTEHCPTHELWQDLSAGIRSYLDDITLADLAERPAVRAAVADY